MEPHINFAIYLASRPVLHLGASRNRVAVRDVVALSVPSELPAMEGTLNGLSYDFSVDSHNHVVDAQSMRLFGLCHTNQSLYKYTGNFSYFLDIFETHISR